MAVSPFSSSAPCGLLWLLRLSSSTPGLGVCYSEIVSESKLIFPVSECGCKALQENSARCDKGHTQVPGSYTSLSFEVSHLASQFLPERTAPKVGCFKQV